MADMPQLAEILSIAAVEPTMDVNWDREIPPKMKRRNPRIWQMAYAAAAGAIADSVRPPRAVLTATALGALDETRSFLDGVFKDGLGSPRSFIASVHNSMAGMLGIEFCIDGPNITFVDGHNSFAGALSSLPFYDSDAFPVLLVAVDERIELLDRLTDALSSVCRSCLLDWSDGAVAVVIDQPSPACRSGIAGLAPCPAYSKDPAVALGELLGAHNLDSAATLPIAETSRSFLAPAMYLHRMWGKSSQGPLTIGSYSPTADTVSAIVVHP